MSFSRLYVRFIILKSHEKSEMDFCGFDAMVMNPNPKVSLSNVDVAHPTELVQTLKWFVLKLIPNRLNLCRKKVEKS